MKVIVIHEENKDENGYDRMKEYLLNGVAKLGPNAEIAIGDWKPEDPDEKAVCMRKIETDGPNAYPPAKVIVENSDAEMLVCAFAPIGTEALDKLPNLKLLAVNRAGLENIDVAEATKRGIPVINASGRNADAVSDFTVGMLLSELRNIARSNVTILNGGWRPEYSNQKTMYDLRNKTIGIFGYGYVGKLTARKLMGFDCNVLVYDPFVKQEDIDLSYVKLVDKETLCKNSDAIIMHSRYCNETHHIIGKKEFDLMKPNCRFINTARAGLVDYDALVDALKNNKIAGAALDVFYEEPISQDNPLLKLNNVTLTSHRAGGTLDTLTYAPTLLCERVNALMDNLKTVGFVNPEVLEGNQELIDWLKNAPIELGRK